MSWFLMGGAVLLAYVVGWWRGYVGHERDVPGIATELRARLVLADDASVAALRRAVKAEETVDRMAAHLTRLEGWLARIRTAAASVEYLRELASMALAGKDPDGRDPVEVRP